MTRLRKWILGGVLGLLIVGGGTVWFNRWAGQVAAEAVTNVDQFHRRAEAGDYAAIYGSLHGRLKVDLSEATLNERLSAAREMLGTAGEMSGVCATKVTTFGSSAFGGKTTVLRVEYVTTFAQAEAWESFDWVDVGDALQLVGYSVETEDGNHDGRPDWLVSFAPRGAEPSAETCSAEGAVFWWQT